MEPKVLNFQVLDGRIQGTFEIPFQEILAAAQTGKYTVTGIETGPQGWVVHLAVPLGSIAMVEASPAPQTGAGTPAAAPTPPQAEEREISAALIGDPVEAKADPRPGPAV
jgi:hypothetical protein